MARSTMVLIPRGGTDNEGNWNRCENFHQGSNMIQVSGEPSMRITVEPRGGYIIYHRNHWVLCQELLS